ncbi:MAG: hypothetical protein JWM74_224, partial [Myxococcaceae bacterium]|nr:hypothetical protein [Myxococcaceae bacterium]
ELLLLRGGHGDDETIYVGHGLLLAGVAAAFADLGLTNMVPLVILSNQRVSKSD